MSPFEIQIHVLFVVEEVPKVLFIMSICSISFSTPSAVLFSTQYSKIGFTPSCFPPSLSKLVPLYFIYLTIYRKVPQLPPLLQIGLTYLRSPTFSPRLPSQPSNTPRPASPPSNTRRPASLALQQTGWTGSSMFTQCVVSVTPC